MDHAGVTADQVKTWIYVQIFINFLFTAELIVFMTIEGSIYRTLLKLSAKVELIYTLVNIFFFIKY